MRLYRNAVILAVVLGLLVGAYYIVKNKKPADTQSQINSRNNERVMDVDSDKISEITVKNKEGTFVLVKKDKEWELTEPKGMNYDKSALSAITANVAPITTDKVIEENPSDIAQYGLKSPSEVSIKLADGSVKAILIGDKASSGGYYVKDKDGSKVYLIGSYTIEKINATKNSLKSKKVFPETADNIIAFSMEKAGSPVFAVKKLDTANWQLTWPIDYNADASKLGPMLEALTGTGIVNFIEENVSDLGKYGLKNPAYSMEVSTSSGKTKVLIGNEKVKGSEIYAKLADGNEVFTMDEKALNFLDKPLKEVIEVFAYIVNIEDVNKIVVEMDGQTVTSDIETFKDDKDKDKFFINGKDATLKDEKDNSYFRKYYQGLIGVTMSEVDPEGKPSGKAEITFTYYLKKSPGVMKVEFIPKNDSTYYVVKNGKYSGILVAKKKFDEPDGVRDTYKKLKDALDKK